MYRGASTLRWFELPGIVAAYQPVRAPDPIAARQNMGAGRMGTYTATPGVPTWTAQMGWINAGGGYVDTFVIPLSSSWSMFGRFSNCTGINQYSGVENAADNDKRFMFALRHFTGTSQAWGNGGWAPGGTEKTAGVIGLANQKGYLNGIHIVNIPTGAAPANVSIYILAVHRDDGSVAFRNTAACQAFAIYSRTLIATEVFTASRQMAYCDTVPEFNAWARQRFYMYAPTTAGFLPAWAGRTNHLIGGGVTN